MSPLRRRVRRRSAIWREFGLADTQTIPVRHTSRYRLSHERSNGRTGRLAMASHTGRSRLLMSPLFARKTVSALSSPNRTILLVYRRRSTDSRRTRSTVVEDAAEQARHIFAGHSHFLPRNGLVPNSSRYILGPESLRAFAPELAALSPASMKVPKHKPRNTK